MKKYTPQLIEHLSNRFTAPAETINKAAALLAKYYFNIEMTVEPQKKEHYPVGDATTSY